MADLPFVGAEAMATGKLNRHQLRTRFRAVFPGVYLDKAAAPTLDTRIRAAWLWSDRKSVVAGAAASALHGAKWIPATATIELISSNTRTPAGIRCRNMSLLGGEVCAIRGIRATTAERTAFDLARFGGLDLAVQRVDALLNATGVKPADIGLLAERHPHHPGLRQLETVLGLVDGGAESPRETTLRLMLVRTDIASPTTQFTVHDERGQFVARLDMAWPELKIAVEYDGEQHRTDRQQYVRDVRRLEALAELGWIVIRVMKEGRPADILRRVRDAIAFRRAPGR